MKKSEAQSLNNFSEMHAIKEAIATKYPPTRSLTETRRIRWGFSGAFVELYQEWLADEAFVPIGLFKTTPVRPRVNNIPDFYCSAYYHPQEQIEALIYKGGGPAGIEFVRYNADSTITITTMDMQMLTPATTPDFYHRIGPEPDPESLQEVEDYLTVFREMLEAIRTEPLPECGCLELNSEEFLQRFENRYARLMEEVDQKIDSLLESSKPVGKRFCLFNFVLKEPMEQVLKHSIHEFKGFNFHNISAEQLIHKIGISFDIMCYKHLEFAKAITPVSYMQQGVDAALEYFFGNWWQEGTGHEGLSESEKNRELHWIEPFVHGMLFILLLQRWDDLSKLCYWLHADIEIEDTTDFEKEVLLFFKLVASSLLPEPLAGLDEIRSSIERCRLKRPKLLLKIWDAIEAMVQSAYEQSMDESLTLYLESVESYIKKGLFQFCVAEFQSVLCLIALKKGLAFPKLPKKSAAALVTRETLGLS